MPDQVKDACDANFDAHSGDCSGFAKAVAGQLGVTLTGQADDIVDTIRTDPKWTRLADGVAAAAAAVAGQLVIGGLRGEEQANPDPHGHVVVVVATAPGQSLAHGRYPFAYWGRLGGVGKENATINFAWRPEDRDNVSYAAHHIPAARV
jgi:hypothetical protein